MTDLKHGPSDAVTVENATNDTKRRLATDFYLTFDTKSGEKVLEFLNEHLSRPPDPTQVNPEAVAWFHLGQRKFMHYIEQNIKAGELIAHEMHGGSK